MNRTSSIDFTSFIAFFNVRNDTPNSLQDDLRERSGVEPTTVPKSSLLATFALLSFLSFSLESQKDSFGVIILSIAVFISKRTFKESFDTW